MLGTVLKDRYRVEAKLGEGGMGVIYRAHDTLLNRPVAIKSLVPALAGEEGIKRLLREAQAAAQLTHPNIVSVHDVIDDGAQRLIVMEYVEGRPLSDLIPLEVPRALDLAVQVCRALEYAHSQRVIHRDIKPENIMVTGGNVAKVADFVLARTPGRGGGAGDPAGAAAAHRPRPAGRPGGGAAGAARAPGPDARRRGAPC